MHDVALPGVHQCVGDLQHVAERVGERERPVGVHQIAEVRAFDVLEDEIAMAALFADVVDAGDVRMIEPGGAAGLHLEAAVRVGVARVRRGEHFHRDDAIEPRVDAAKDGPHPAAADELFEPDVAELLARHRLRQLARLLPTPERVGLEERRRGDHGLIVRQRGAIDVDCRRGFVRRQIRVQSVA